MNSSIFIRCEILQMIRNRRFFIFSLVFPVFLYFLIAGSKRHELVYGIPFPRYNMAGMAAWGSMEAVIAGGSRIAAERSAGWTRQIRITPLSTWRYFQAKVLSGYLMAILSVIAVSFAGTMLGVRQSLVEWSSMGGLILLGLIPFVVLGVLLGHILSVDSMGPATNGIIAVFALLGGAWGPLINGGFLGDVVQGIPSYWLVRSGKTAMGGLGWPARGWIVLVIWTGVLTLMAVRVYKRDTERV